MPKTDSATTTVVDALTVEPDRAQVVLINDDTTTFEFVIDLLVSLFGHPLATAVALTMQIHEEGEGVAGEYTVEIAEHLAATTRERARRAGFPLQVEVRLVG